MYKTKPITSTPYTTQRASIIKTIISASSASSRGPTDSCLAAIAMKILHQGLCRSWISVTCLDSRRSTQSSTSLRTCKESMGSACSRKLQRNRRNRAEITITAGVFLHCSELTLNTCVVWVIRLILLWLAQLNSIRLCVSNFLVIRGLRLKFVLPSNMQLVNNINKLQMKIECVEKGLIDLYFIIFSFHFPISSITLQSISI